MTIAVHERSPLPCRERGCPATFLGGSDAATDAFREQHEKVVHGRVFTPTGYKQTSRTAYHAVLERRRETERRILALFDRYGPMTDEQLFERFYDLHGGYRNTVAPARNALYKADLVYDTLTRRKVRSGRTAIVWAKR